MTPASVTNTPVLPPVNSGPGVDEVITYRLSLTFVRSGSGGRACCCCAAIAAVNPPATSSAPRTVARFIGSLLQFLDYTPCESRRRRRSPPAPEMVDRGECPDQ